MQIAKNSVVTMHYRLTDDAGVELDRSDEGEPLVFIHGHGTLIPGLEAALVGKKKADSFNIKIPTKDAYGEHDERLRTKMPRSSFDNQDQLLVGARFQAESDEGYSIVTIIDVNDKEVTIDGNHPLAGLDLIFDISIVDVRAATKEEIAHGHVHGEGGHHHHD